MIFALITTWCVVGVLLWALVRADRDYRALEMTAHRLRGENKALRAKNTDGTSVTEGGENQEEEQ